MTRPRTGDHGHTHGASYSNGDMHSSDKVHPRAVILTRREGATGRRVILRPPPRRDKCGRLQEFSVTRDGSRHRGDSAYSTRRSKSASRVRRRGSTGGHAREVRLRDESRSTSRQWQHQHHRWLRRDASRDRQSSRTMGQTVLYRGGDSLDEDHCRLRREVGHEGADSRDSDRDASPAPLRRRLGSRQPARWAKLTHPAPRWREECDRSSDGRQQVISASGRSAAAAAVTADSRSECGATSPEPKRNTKESKEVEEVLSELTSLQDARQEPSVVGSSPGHRRGQGRSTETEGLPDRTQDRRDAIRPQIKRRLVRARKSATGQLRTRPFGSNHLGENEHHLGCEACQGLDEANEPGEHVHGCLKDEEETRDGGNQTNRSTVRLACDQGFVIEADTLHKPTVVPEEGVDMEGVFPGGEFNVVGDSSDYPEHDSRADGTRIVLSGNPHGACCAQVAPVDNFPQIGVDEDEEAEDVVEEVERDDAEETGGCGTLPAAELDGVEAATANMAKESGNSREVREDPVSRRRRSRSSSISSYSTYSGGSVCSYNSRSRSRGAGRQIQVRLRAGLSPPPGNFRDTPTAASHQPRQAQPQLKLPSPQTQTHPQIQHLPQQVQNAPHLQQLQQPQQLLYTSQQLTHQPAYQQQHQHRQQVQQQHPAVAVAGSHSVPTIFWDYNAARPATVAGHYGTALTSSYGLHSGQYGQHVQMMHNYSLPAASHSYSGQHVPQLGYGRVSPQPEPGRRERRGRGRRRNGGSPNRKRRKSLGEPPQKFGDTWEEHRSTSGLKLISDLAPQGVSWEYQLHDESRRSFAALMKSPLNYEQLDAFFRMIRDGTEWTQPTGPFGLLPRKTAWMVVPGCQCPYRYGGVEVKPQVFPAWMSEILGAYMPYCGFSDRASWPNSCNLNLYENGSHSVGWHADDEALFQGLHRDTRIISLSLGQTRKFDVKKNWPEDGEKNTYQILLTNGALATMEGMLQKHYQHRVPKEDENLGPRINVTWRWILRHCKDCSFGR